MQFPYTNCLTKYHIFPYNRYSKRNRENKYHLRLKVPIKKNKNENKNLRFICHEKFTCQFVTGYESVTTCKLDVVNYKQHIYNLFVL